MVPAVAKLKPVAGAEEWMAGAPNKDRPGGAELPEAGKLVGRWHCCRSISMDIEARSWNAHQRQKVGGGGVGGDCTRSWEHEVG